MKFETEDKVTERIQTFEDACEALGKGHPFVKSYNTYVNILRGEEAAVIAFLGLRIICAALNEGMNIEEQYYPWFSLYTTSDYKELANDIKKECRLAVMSYYVNNKDIGPMYVRATGSGASPFIHTRLSLKTKELAEYCGKQFLYIWVNYLFK